MDRDMVLGAAHSARRNHVARQFALIAELERRGHDTRCAQAVLTTMREAQVLYQQDRERILRELQRPWALPENAFADVNLRNRFLISALDR
jgi:hypothetical protein